MDRVFIASIDYHYEDSVNEGVFSSLQGAREFMWKTYGIWNADWHSNGADEWYFTKQHDGKTFRIVEWDVE